MYHATVEWFNEGKGFGKASPDGGGESIFLHINQQTEIKEGEYFPEFVVGYRSKRANTPIRGTRVVCDVEEGAKGPYALCWGLEADFLRIQASIDNRPMYRILSARKEPEADWDSAKSEVLWEGTNLWAPGLQNKYHPIQDRLAHHGEHFSSRKWWQISRDSGDTWTDCDCPDEYRFQFDGRGRRLT